MSANYETQIYQAEMAAMVSAKKALWALLRSYNAQRCAKLTVSTEKGKLKISQCSGELRQAHQFVSIVQGPQEGHTGQTGLIFKVDYPGHLIHSLETFSHY